MTFDEFKSIQSKYLILKSKAEEILNSASEENAKLKRALTCALSSVLTIIDINKDYLEKYRYNCNEVYEISDKFYWGHDPKIILVGDSNVTINSYLGGGDYTDTVLPIAWFFDHSLIDDYFKEIKNKIEKQLQSEQEKENKRQEEYDLAEYERLKKKFENANT